MVFLTSFSAAYHQQKKHFLSLSWKKKVVFFVIIIAVLGFGYYKFALQRQVTPQYQTATAEKGTLVQSITSSGTISGGNTVSITSAASGVVSQVYVKEGDSVSAGEKIADITLDQASLQKQTEAWANYLTAQNNVNSAQAKLNSLQSALFKANQAFVTDKGIPNPSDANKADPKYIEEQADWQQAEADYKNQQGVIAAANASFSSSWLSYQQYSSSIVAPVSGVISNLTIAPGIQITTTSSSNINATATTTLGTISPATDQLQATINLSEIDVTKVAVGQKATLTLDAYTGKTFTGRVSTINTNGTVSSGVTTYPTTITMDETTDKIYPNMGVNATIITNVKDDVLLVPTSAIQTQNGTSTVRVLKNGQIQSVPVETGISNDTQTEITSGISEGDTVVTSVATQRTTGATSSPFGRGFGGGGGNVRINTGRGG